MNSSAQAAGWHREIAQPPLAVHRCRRCHLFCASGSSLLMRLALLQYTSPRGAVHLCEVVQAMDLSRLEAQLGHACVCQTSVCAAKRSACAPRLFGTSHRSNAKARWRAGVDARRPLHSALSFEATRGISLQFTKAFVLNRFPTKIFPGSPKRRLTKLFVRLLPPIPSICSSQRGPFFLPRRRMHTAWSARWPRPAACVSALR